jgi:hypothetical protein
MKIVLAGSMRRLRAYKARGRGARLAHILGIGAPVLAIELGEHHAALVTALGHELRVAAGRAVHQAGFGRIPLSRKLQARTSQAAGGQVIANPVDARPRPQGLETLL